MGQAARRVIYWRFIVGSIDSFKDSWLRSFGGVTSDIHRRILFHRKEGAVTRRMASIVHRCRFRSGLFTPVTDHQLQPMPAFRVEVCYSIRYAEPCIILSTKGRERCVFKVPTSFRTPHSARAFCRAARRLLVCPRKNDII